MSLWSLVGSLTQPEPIARYKNKFDSYIVPIGWQRPTKLKKKNAGTGRTTAVPHEKQNYFNTGFYS